MAAPDSAAWYDFSLLYPLSIVECVGGGSLIDVSRMNDDGRGLARPLLFFWTLPPMNGYGTYLQHASCSLSFARVAVLDEGQA